MLYKTYQIWSQHLFTHIKAPNKRGHIWLHSTDASDFFFFFCRGFLTGHSCGGEDNFQEAQ